MPNMPLVLCECGDLHSTMTIFSRTTATQQSTCVGLQEAVGCAREQEAEALADVRWLRDRWRSFRCWWTRVEMLKNKRRSVTRDDVTTNQTKVAQQVENGRRKIEAEVPADYRRQRNKRRRGLWPTGADGGEQEGKGQTEARERLVVKRRRRRRKGGQEAAARRESEASGIS